MNQSLLGNAAHLINCMHATGDNFQLAWDTLCRQFDNIHRKLTHQLDTLMRFPKSEEESIDHLNLLITTDNESMVVFRSLNCPTDYWNQWLKHCVVAKHDPSTKLECVGLLGKIYIKAFPKYKALEIFLGERVQTLLITAMEFGLAVKGQNSQQKSGMSTGQSTKGPKNPFGKTKPQGASAHTAVNCDRKVTKSVRCAMRSTF